MANYRSPLTNEIDRLLPIAEHMFPGDRKLQNIYIIGELDHRWHRDTISNRVCSRRSRLGV